MGVNLEKDPAFAYAILRSARHFNFHWKQLMANNGHAHFSQEQWEILHRLATSTKIAQSDLVDKQFNDKANITRIIEKLQTKSLVTVSKDVEDQRKKWVTITSSGLIYYRIIEEIILNDRDKTYDGLTSKDFKALQRILNKLDENIL